jgi:hypothetical protein
LAPCTFARTAPSSSVTRRCHNPRPSTSLPMETHASSRIQERASRLLSPIPPAKQSRSRSRATLGTAIPTSQPMPPDRATHNAANNSETPYPAPPPQRLRRASKASPVGGGHRPCCRCHRCRRLPSRTPSETRPFRYRKKDHHRTRQAARPRRCLCESLALSGRQGEAHSLENDTASFRSRFQAAVGQTIDYAATHPAERPREVDFAVLESKPFDRAYTQVLDSRPSLEDVRARKDILAAIETRLRDALSGDEDKRILDELVQWMKDRRAALDGQGGNLTLLETTLKKYRNDPRLSGP